MIIRKLFFLTSATRTNPSDNLASLFVRHKSSRTSAAARSSRWPAAFLSRSSALTPLLASIMRKSLWSPDEDEKLRLYVDKHGCGNWSDVAKHTGLQRCGKSCRLRWINYLRPDLKRGPFSAEEIRLVVTLHRNLGNSWSKIATYVPGRTDNDIKNFWHSYTRSKRMQQQPPPQHRALNGEVHEQPVTMSGSYKPGSILPDKKCDERSTNLGVSAFDEILSKANSSFAVLCEYPFVAQQAGSDHTQAEFDGTEVQMKQIADQFLYSGVPVPCGIVQDHKPTMPLEINQPCLLGPGDEEAPEGLQSVIWNFVNRQLPATEICTSSCRKEETARSEAIPPCMTTPQRIDEFWRGYHKSLPDMQAGFLPGFQFC